MTIKAEILRSDALTEIAEHARQLTRRKTELASDLSMRGSQLSALRALLVENGMDDTDESRDAMLTEIDGWLTWISGAATALTNLSEMPDTLP